jgi:phosphoglycolate phosphatase-like HAD superfamily hydrolase
VAVAVDVAGPLDEDTFWRLKRGGASTATALAALGIRDADSAAAEWVSQIEDESWLALDRALPGAERAVAELRAAGWSPVVVTARRHPDRARAQVSRLGLEVAEVAVVSPARAVAEKAAELDRLGAAALVGDSEADIAAARRAGVAFEVVASGQRDDRFLRRQGVERVHAGISDAVAAVLLEIGPAASGSPPT